MMRERREDCDEPADTGNQETHLRSHNKPPTSDG
jgi:hypothetical protein